MQGFHQFISSRSRQFNIESFSQLNQRSKQITHDEDQNYLMNDDQNDLNDSNCQQIKNHYQIQQEEEEPDPLDAFMNELEEKNQSQQPQLKILKNQNLNKEKQKNNQNIQNEEESSYESDGVQAQFEGIIDFREESEKFEGQICENDDQNQGELGQKKQRKSKKIIETLKPFDFSKIDLQDFQKNFYTEHQDIARLSQAQVVSLRKQFEIKVHGDQIPRPIVSFAHLELNSKIKSALLKQQFQKPTPIQSQALPIALKGRDLIGVAKTGSGKTLAYLLPMIVHVEGQRQAKKNEGPVGLILAPTRQLCQQIFIQAKKYTKKMDVRVGCLLGGQNKHEQWKVLRAGLDMLIASPGRLIQMIKKKATNTHRVTYLVLDQADKMLSLGFEHQIRSIVSQTRSDRQTLLFTATMKQQVQFLAYDILESPIRVICGDQHAANQNVNQKVVILDEESEKESWLQENIQEIVSEGKVLIFCNQKEKCKQVKEHMMTRGVEALTLYGDKSQYERTMVMNEFKGGAKVLIATDIASRGLDVKGIKTVINLECPQNIESYIHRIGRAGRGEETGTSISLLVKKASSIKFAIQLVKIFESSGYPVSRELEDLACMDEFYRRKRMSSKMGVSFAKGKDASRFLSQILKQQQRGNSKAGIGMALCEVKGKGNGKGGNTNDANHRKGIRNEGYKDENEDQCSDSDFGSEQKGMRIAEILRERQKEGGEMSISQMARVIGEEKRKKEEGRLSSRELSRNFRRSRTNEWNL